jgi:hypothetical protein
MRPKRLLFLAVMAASLMLPAAARADHGPIVMDETLGRYMEIAAGYWGAEPDCPGARGEPTGVHAVLFDDPDPRVAAMAELGGCRIWLDRDMWPGPADEERCNVLVHEWGHLLGHGHSTDSSDLMWPDWMNLVVPGCMAFRPAPPAGPPLKEAHPPAKKPRKKTTHKKTTHRKTATRCTRRPRRTRKSRAKRCARPAPKHRRTR